MLGFMYVKLAEEAGRAQPPQEVAGSGDFAPKKQALPGVLGQDVATHGTNAIPTVTRTGTGAQVLQAWLGDITGDPQLAAALGPVIPLIAGILPEGAADSLLRQRRFSSGSGTAREAAQISQALSAVNARLMAKHTDALAERTGAFLKALPDEGAAGAIKQAGGFIQGLVTEFPKVAGPLIMMLRQSDIAGVSPLVNQFFGDIPTSYMPIVQAVYKENGGTLDPALLQQRVNEFEQGLASGAFMSREHEVDRNGATVYKMDENGQPIRDPTTGEPKPKLVPMSADVSMGSYGIAAQHLGRDATADDRANLARLAHTIMGYGLAKNSDAAFTMLGAMDVHGALTNPIAFDTKMKDMATRLRAVSPDVPGQALGALEQAMKTGMPFEHALQYSVADAERRQVWARSGKTPEQVAAFNNLAQAAHVTRTKGFAEAESIKGLAAWVTQTQQGQSAYHDFLAEPTVEKSQAMFAASHNAPTWSTRGDFDGNTLRADMSPKHMTALQVGEQAAYSTEVGGRKGTLARIMRDPEAYRDMIEDPARMSDTSRKLFSKMSPYERQYMNNVGRRGILTEYMAERDAEHLPKSEPTGLVPYGEVQKRVDAYVPPPPKIDPVKTPTAPPPPIPVTAP